MPTHADPTSNGRYVVRALHADEQDAWLDLLAAAFATKGVPRSFFEGVVISVPVWLYTYPLDMYVYCILLVRVFSGTLVG